MEITTIKSDIENLKQINHGIQSTENYMCIDCHIRRLREYINSLKEENGCKELVEEIHASILQYYMNRHDKKEIVESVSKLIDILKEKVQ